MKYRLLLMLLCCIWTILFPLSASAESGYVGDGDSLWDRYLGMGQVLGYDGCYDSGTCPHG